MSWTSQRISGFVSVNLGSKLSTNVACYILDENIRANQLVLIFANGNPNELTLHHFKGEGQRAIKKARKKPV